MTFPILCSAEEFIAKSNEIINPSLDKEYGYVAIFRAYLEHSTLVSESSMALANALKLASKICSMMLTDNPEQPFKNHVQIGEYGCEVFFHKNKIFLKEAQCQEAIVDSVAQEKISLFPNSTLIDSLRRITLIFFWTVPYKMVDKNKFLYYPNLIVLLMIINIFLVQIYNN